METMTQIGITADPADRRAAASREIWTIYECVCYAMNLEPCTGDMAQVEREVVKEFDETLFDGEERVTIEGATSIRYTGWEYLVYVEPHELTDFASAYDNLISKLKASSDGSYDPAEVLIVASGLGYSALGLRDAGFHVLPSAYLEQLAQEEPPAKETTPKERPDPSANTSANTKVRGDGWLRFWTVTDDQKDGEAVFQPDSVGLRLVAGFCDRHPREWSITDIIGELYFEEAQKAKELGGDDLRIKTRQLIKRVASMLDFVRDKMSKANINPDIVPRFHGQFAALGQSVTLNVLKVYRHGDVQVRQKSTNSGTGGLGLDWDTYTGGGDEEDNQEEYQYPEDDNFADVEIDPDEAARNRENSLYDEEDDSFSDY